MKSAWKKTFAWPFVWYWKLTTTNKIVIICCLIAAVPSYLQLTKPDAVEKKPVEQTHTDVLSDVSITDDANGKNLPVVATNSCTTAETNMCAATVDFGLTNRVAKTPKRMIRVESDVITVSGTTVLNHYAIPPSPALTNVPIRLDTNVPVRGDEFTVHYTKAMDDLVKGASADFMRCRFTNAFEKANAAWKLHWDLMKEGQGRPLRFDTELIHGLLKIIPIMIDEAMSRNDFDAMELMANQYDMFCVEPDAYCKAIREIAQLKRAGGKLIFFSPAQLRELRDMKPDCLLRYLNTLAIKGFLQPVELDASCRGYHRISYEDFFGLRGELRYVKSWRLAAKDKDGKALMSDLVAGQWAGLGRIVNIDVGEAASIALGLPEDQRQTFPLELKVEYAECPWGPDPTGRILYRRREVKPKLTDYMREIIKEDSSEVADEHLGDPE